jgi:nonribosomal peptide synthetase DhbF
VYRSLLERFRETCARRPDQPAVIHGAQTLTYAELDREARALAAELVRRGVRPGELVGLRVARSIEIPVAIIGILTAGAAYVPLDPQYPDERLRMMAEDAGITRIAGDDIPIRGHAPAADAEFPEPGPEDRAYVIYTSGSTGRPKGCVVTHRNVLSLLAAALPLFDVGPEDRWTLFHSVSFDVSVWELWGALATGGTAVVVDADAAADPMELLDLVIAQRVSVLLQIPAVFRLLAEAHADAGCPRHALRYVIFAGEAVDLATAAAFGARQPGQARLVNMYGPTETTVYATYKLLDDAALHGANRSPIGRPLPHLAIALRDPDGAEVPDGAAGEMWISGAGVCAGYLHRDDLTAERFVTVDGLRCYRTGDLARRLPDGELEFLGRADRQVKVRGFRIEPGEIEAVLRGCAGIRDAVVEVVTAGDGTAFLVAYVVAEDERLGVARARAACAQSLPPHMVPNTFTLLPAIPLTPSGKVDRDALAAA